MADPVVSNTDAPSGTGAERTDLDAIQTLLNDLGITLGNHSQSDQAAILALAGDVIAQRQKISTLTTALEKSELLADRDALCPVFNRRAFERELKREIALAERYQTPLCLIFIDLDNFKLVNDRFGHQTGDRVLKYVSQVLLDNLRQTDIVGRMGGDEFAIVLTHAEQYHGEQKAKSLAETIDAVIVRDRANASLPAVTLGASCGVLSWEPGMEGQRLIALADETMFRVKAERKADR